MYYGRFCMSVHRAHAVPEIARRGHQIALGLGSQMLKSHRAGRVWELKPRFFGTVASALHCCTMSPVPFLFLQRRSRGKVCRRSDWLQAWDVVHVGLELLVLLSITFQVLRFRVLFVYPAATFVIVCGLRENTS